MFGLHLVFIEEYFVVRIHLGLTSNILLISIDFIDGWTFGTFYELAWANAVENLCIARIASQNSIYWNTWVS